MGGAFARCSGGCAGSRGPSRPSPACRWSTSWSPRCCRSTPPTSTPGAPSPPSGGIADQKAPRIQRILAEIEGREGRIDLTRLEGLSDREVEEYLTSLQGVGPKTAACVLTFSMGRAAFPVDTHVHRVTARLGWIPPGASAERAHQLLARRVPAEVRYDLHVALVTHGRTVCKAQRPRCDTCVLRDLCAYGSTPQARRSATATAPA